MPNLYTSESGLIDVYLNFFNCYIVFYEKGGYSFFTFSALSIGPSGELIDKSESESLFDSNKPSPNRIDGTLYNI